MSVIFIIIIRALSYLDYTFRQTASMYEPLLLLLSCFSRVRLCATPQTAVHQAPPSLRFSRQEHWSGLPFPSPVYELSFHKYEESVQQGKY